MRKSTVVLLLATTLVFTVARSSEAWWGRGPRVVVGVGPFFPYPYAYPPYPYPYYPPPYYPPPYYPYPAPVVMQQQPQVYVQQPAVQPAPALAPAPPTQWYYCASSHGYYPTVPKCREAWIKIPPPPG